MKRRIHLFLLIALPLITAFTLWNAFTWNIEEGYSIRFDGKKASCVFTAFRGDIVFDADHLQDSKFDVTVDAASIDTGNKLKNKHARSSKWFDVEKYPLIKFSSRAISKRASGYSTTGILDMHGVQKEIVIPFTFRNDTFAGSFHINRLDYGIGKSKGMSGNVGPGMKIDIAVPVRK